MTNSNSRSIPRRGAGGKSSLAGGREKVVAFAFLSLLLVFRVVQVSHMKKNHNRLEPSPPVPEEESLAPPPPAEPKGDDEKKSASPAVAEVPTGPAVPPEPTASTPQQPTASRSSSASLSLSPTPIAVPVPPTPAPPVPMPATESRHESDMPKSEVIINSALRVQAEKQKEERLAILLARMADDQKEVEELRNAMVVSKKNESGGGSDASSSSDAAPVNGSIQT